MRLVLIILFTFFHFMPSKVRAQERIPLYRLQSAYIIHFINYTTWNDDESIDSFRIAIVGKNPELLLELEAAVGKVNMRYPEIIVKSVTDNALLRDFHLVFVGKKKVGDVGDIASMSRRSNTLLVTYECDELPYIMMNLRSNSDGTLRFEVNKSNIEYQGLQMDSELLLLGGTKLDVAELLRETEDALREQTQLLDERHAQLEIMRASSQTQQTELEELRESYHQQHLESDRLLEKMEHSKKELNYVYRERDSILTQSNLELSEKQDALTKQQLLVQEKEKQVSELAGQIHENWKILGRQEDYLKAKRESLTTLEEKLGTQQQIIWILATSALVTLLLFLIILRFARLKNRASRELEERNIYLLSIQNKLKTATREADKANLAKSTFLANMSHEIRTPMNAVLGYAQILKRNSSIDVEVKKTVNAIYKSGGYLLNLINDILDISKIEAGKVAISPVAFDFHLLLGDMQEMFRVKVLENRLKFSLDIHADVPKFIEADQYRVQQIIINLLGNAVKFTKKGSIQLSVRVKNNMIHCTVADTGQGIPNDQLETIFNTFEQADVGENIRGGTGLGLTISRQLARLMDGDVTVSSTIDKGSEFLLTFKYKEVKTKKIEFKSLNRVVKRLKNGQSDLRVLVVDDKEDNRNVLRLLLEPLGFIIKEAINGKEAIDITKSWKPKIILMDLVMPKINGKEAIEQIRQLDINNAPTIIAISAGSFEEDDKEIVRTGANAFIKKPFKEWELLEKMRHHADLTYEYSIDQAEELSAEFVDEGKFKKLPKELQKQIERAAIEGDIDQLEEIGKEIRKTEVDMANYFIRLVDDFELDRIQNLVNGFDNPK